MSGCHKGGPGPWLSFFGIDGRLYKTEKVEGHRYVTPLHLQHRVEPSAGIRGVSDYRTAYETMKDYIVHVHFKDCKDEHGKVEMQHFGEGIIDFPWIVEQLNANGYQGDFALEYELHTMKAEVGLKKFRDDFVALFDKRVNDS